MATHRDPLERFRFATHEIATVTRLSIIEYPDPRLSCECAPVEFFNGSVSELVHDLFETLYATSGIGLCAPQCGVMQRVLVMDLSDDGSEPQEFINPALVSMSVPCIVEESCLSIPGVVGNVLRKAQLQIVAFDRLGNRFERELEGMHAVCLQHEIDHLDGKLFIERLSLIKRLRIRAHLQALSDKAAPQQELEAVS